MRDERDLQAHVDYIHYNPVKHGHAIRVMDWPYSSFHRFVRQGMLPVDWGGEAVDDVLAGEWIMDETAPWWVALRSTHPTTQSRRTTVRITQTGDNKKARSRNIREQA